MSDLKATTSRSSFWKDWKEKREAKKQERQEEAVRATTDKIAENEKKLSEAEKSLKDQEAQLDGHCHKRSGLSLPATDRRIDAKRP